jgi:hypothetical protein
MISQLSIELPSTDVSLLKQLGDKMGWTIHAHKSSSTEAKNAKTSHHTPSVERLRQLCQNTTFTDKEIEEDERLRYILEERSKRN